MMHPSRRAYVEEAEPEVGQSQQTIRQPKVAAAQQHRQTDPHRLQDRGVDLDSVRKLSLLDLYQEADLT